MLLRDAVGKATPSTRMVHRDRPLGAVRHKDDPGTDPLIPDLVKPGIEDGIQDPFDYRDLNEDSLPKMKAGDKKDDDDPGTQDVSPPNQSAVDIGPLDVIVPQDEFGKIEKRISGNSPIGLNALGRSLADKLAGRIAAKGCLDVLYSSTLARGVETVQPILKACPTTKYAGAESDLCPWRLGVYEGKEPKDVKGQIVYFIEHPDEVPPGAGADGKPAESFDAAKERQLGFFRRVYADYTADPTLKIGIQTHSRGQELLQAWVDADCPDDYELDEKDVIHPDDRPHATMMRWHKDDIKDVDLDSDDPLKPGVYLILHSLTDDDTDDGNPELEDAEKFDPSQPRGADGKFGTGFHGTSIKAANSILKSGLKASVENGKSTWACTTLNKEEAKAYGNGSKRDYAVVLVDVKKSGMQEASWNANYRVSRSDVPASAIIGVELYKAGSDTPYKTVKKADDAGTGYIVVFPDDEIEKLDQQRDDRGRFGSGNSVTADLKSTQAEHDRLKDHPARSGGNVSASAESAFMRDVDKFGDRVGRLVNTNTSALMSVKYSTGSSAYRAASNQLDAARSMMHEAQSREGDERMWRVDTALSGFHSALLYTSKVLGSKWVGKAGEHIGKDAHVNHMLTRRVYMPPIEVHRAAKSALDAGVSVIDVTYPLAESRGLDLEHVKMVADFFAASESATAPLITRNAYGGVNAVKWAAKVISKAHKEWPSWVGVDWDGTLVELTVGSYDGTASGKPIPAMVAKVKAMLAEGKSVRIFTARVADDVDGKKAGAIKARCVEMFGRELPVTNEKDPGMVKLIDDRAVNADEVNKAGSGVMVSLWLDPSIAEKLTVPGGEDAKEMHVTLAYLGKLDALDMSALPGLEQAVKAYAAMHAPLEGVIAGPTRFHAKPQTEGRDVCVATFEHPGIQEFRAGLVDAIKAAGVDVPRVFAYTPHVTLKYIAPDADMPTQRVEPLPVTFRALTLSVGGARKEYTLSGTVVKYSPDQPRAADGEFGSGSGGRAKASDRVERARKSAVLIGTKEQAIADRAEQKLSDALGVPRTKDNSAFDLKNDDVGIECKCLLVGAHEKITMSKSALARKVAEVRDDDIRGYTVVADMRGGRERASYYYKEGFGSFRLGSMTKVTLSELRSVVRGS